MRVRAKTTITENNFNGEEVWTHANPGDEGVVISIDWGYPTVFFAKSATVVSWSEVVPVLWDPDEASAGERSEPSEAE